jgi:RNA polymerase sigma-70 factor, ECF subfamily
MSERNIFQPWRRPLFGRTTTLNTNRNFVDLEMVERLQKGDSEAFAGLFHAHKARIYYICLRMTNNTVQAEDLTRDAFLQVFRKLSTFEGNSPLSTWFLRSAINTVLTEGSPEADLATRTF